MAIMLRLLYALISIASLVHGLSPAEWRAQSIYQVMTDRFARSDGSTTAACDLNEYCGGTWQGLISRLSYIQNMGFTAVWISPVVQNPINTTGDGNSYHGYWANDVYKLNPKFGTAADLKALSDALHSRGMYLMVDVVPNHMGSISTRANVNYSALNPFNNQSYYHPPCSIDYNNDTSIKQCWAGSNTVSLPDLRTEDTVVQDMWGRWISQLVSNYSIDGLRIDTAYQINQGFWAGFQAAAGGIHTIGEVWHNNPSVVCPYENYLHGLMNYPSYYYITQAFQNTSGNVPNLVSGINTMRSGVCRDITVMGSFIENHDNPRFPSYTSDNALIHNAIAFALLADGIPIVYQGQEQNFNGSGVPSNREQLWKSAYNENSALYHHIRKLNCVRSWAARQDSGYLTYNARPIQSDKHTVVMRKGSSGKQVISIYSNRGAIAANTFLTIAATSCGLTGGMKVVDVLTCVETKADRRGNLCVTVVQGQPQVLYPSAGLKGSGICGR
ncbi:glycoside hydrolase family 13 protein [Dothistroma septosporum NZE10]|uniref:alpha-amylase n=1 Tax=Dothistroma septosporum (strain NZE10 / CBS 128990) TaxID=675120 RepID=M2WKK1_DOTSN|nr:glycoside hydrolase family 13 protein [Dothistroma septosporum NZE10]